MMVNAFPIDGIILDRKDAANLHRQLYKQLRSLIEHRVLPSGSALPSTRAMAKDLGVGRNTVIAACDQLALEGFLALRPKTPPIIMALPSKVPSAAAKSTEKNSSISERGKVMLAQPYHYGKPGLLAFHPGLPDADNFPFNTWSKLLSKRAKTARHDLFGTYHVKGYPPLCEAIARYLKTSRGVNCTPDQIVVTNGAQSSFDLLARLLLDPGDTVWMEEPGYYGASAAFLSAGAKLSPLYVNEKGWHLKPPATKPKLIFATPSCHHPLGITMPMEQRLNLVQLAENWKAWIIEDDYDSEYRFQGHQIPALQGINANNRVVYVGTFAKILFPAMRLGFMVVPDILRENIATALSVTGQFAPLLTQAALADFMNEGHFTKHLRRMRRIYTVRREYFIDGCNEYLSPWLRLREVDAGIQIVALFHQNFDDKLVVKTALQHDVNVSPLSIQFRFGHEQRGLVMGFAAADQHVTKKALLKLRGMFQSTKFPIHF